MMRTQAALLLVCTFISGAFSLLCYPYDVDPSTGKVIYTTCGVQCASSTTSVDISVFGGLTPLTLSTLFFETSCGAPDLCTNTSISLGLVKITNNTQCCSTNYCNNRTLPVLPKQPPNGKMCYVCNQEDCSEQLYCEGAEDRCITGLVTQSSNAVIMKGCTTRNVCNMTQIKAQGLFVSNLQCCEGNLCNGAESFTLSFLLMIIPLLSSILFY